MTICLRLLAPLLLGFLALPAIADPEVYRLEAARSSVNFTYDFQGTATTGTMPVLAARMRLDLDRISASEVDVTLDARGARAGFFFATQTMKGPKVLDTKQFPTIHFHATRIVGTLASASVIGELTVRDVTRPVTMQAGLYRQRGTEAGSRDRLTVLLTGRISRSAFGAGGFPGYVGDTIALRIIARIVK